MFRQKRLRDRLRLVVSGLCLCAMAATAGAQTFTLEQITSAPFPSNLCVSKRGDKIAWAFDAHGRRNLWIAEAPDFKGRQLTRYTEDDGQELSDLTFSPDGGALAYVRGGEKNGVGEVPNPTSDPAGARQEVWLADLRTGHSVKLGEGSAPLFSPQGESVAFIREGHLWSVPARGGAEKKMFEMRGSVESPVWSPDGTQLAFVSSRREHSFIAVYQPRERRLRLLQPSVDRDVLPRWSPDGKRLAFVRLFNVADTYSADKERLAPWSIWIANVGDGSGREIWKSGSTENDSFPELMNENFWEWAANDRIVFGSERDGWAHLYSIHADGGPVTALTPGNYEVENIAYSPDKSFIVFSSNAGDIDRRHLWRVNVTGGEPQPVTRGEGIEMHPALLNAGRRLVFFHSTARDPFQPYLASVDGSGLRPLAPQALPADFPAAQLIQPEPVVFTAADGMEIHGQLFKPRNAHGKRPALVFMHGGPIRQMLLGWHYMYYYHNAYAFNQYLASRGYMVLSVNYRSGIGYGRAFREALHRGPRGASEYQDVVAAGKFLRARGDVDGKRIGLWGGSYGGYLTAMGLAHDSDLFAAGVDFHGVHDWSATVGRAPWATGELSKLGRESSPIVAIDKWRSPVLLIHGDDDRNVNFNQTIMLVRELRRRGVEFEQLIYPDEIHDFLRHGDWLRAYQASSDFFDRHLK